MVTMGVKDRRGEVRKGKLMKLKLQEEENSSGNGNMRQREEGKGRRKQRERWKRVVRMRSGEHGGRRKIIEEGNREIEEIRKLEWKRGGF